MITSYADYYEHQQNPQQRISQWRLGAGSNLIVGFPFNSWLCTPDAGAAPGAAAVPTNATAGAMGQQDGTNLRLLKLTTAIRDNSATTPIFWRLILADRLSHQSGLSGTAAGAQTTNLPTAALTRYTTGVGVFASLDVYTLIGNTGTTFTCSYTNEAGTAGQVSPATVIGGPNFRSPERSMFMPLQVGDRGVRAVASVTLAGTTGTAGNFGVTLWKPLVAFTLRVIRGQSYDPLFDTGANLPVIQNGACLYWLAIPLCTNATSTPQFVFTAALAEDP